MKLSSIFTTKKSLMKKIDKRNQKRIKELTNVSTAFKPEDSKNIRDNIDSIARYANRKKITLQFEPSAEDLSAAKMSVYKKQVKFYDKYDGSEPMSYTVDELAGYTVLPKGLNNKKDLMDTIRSEAAKILYEKK